MYRICGEKPARKGRDAATGLPVVAYRYGLSMLVGPEALPEGMGQRLLAVADPARPLVEDNALGVTVGVLVGTGVGVGVLVGKGVGVGVGRAVGSAVGCAGR